MGLVAWYVYASIRSHYEKSNPGSSDNWHLVCRLLNSVSLRLPAAAG